MEAVWSEGPLTAEEIVQAVAPARHWGEATVKTLTNRLLKNQALASEPTGGRALYHPLVTRSRTALASAGIAKSMDMAQHSLTFV